MRRLRALIGFGNTGLTIWSSLACKAMRYQDREQERLSLQARLDAEKTQADRNRLGQFSTPAALARDILQFGVALFGEERPIRFIDPAIGTGSFFSALLCTVAVGRIEAAKGYELDTHYGVPAQELWRGTTLDMELGDFTKSVPPASEAERYNLLVCNPPYVRHHHVANSEKRRLQDATEVACGVRIAGLAGLYCYFLGLSHSWMQRGGIAGWLIPSEFMDVNYGEAIKRYLLDKVTLLRIHRFDPKDTQFDDALVSSAVVWFRQEERTPAPIVCTYLGRTDTKSKRPFRFILNHSQATDANVYLLLYLKPVLTRAMARDGTLMRRVWQALNALSPDALLGEGRVYGGGLHKLEPKELANVDATAIADLIPGLRPPVGVKQLDIFEESESVPG